MSVCRTCRSVIKFVTMEDTRRLVPVEPIPDPTGTVAARSVKPAHYGMHPALFGYMLSRSKPLRDGYTLYRTHHAECARIRPITAAETAPPVPATLFD